VSEIVVLRTTAVHEYAKANVAARHSFLNGTFSNSGFLGIGQSGYNGNSVALGNCLQHLKMLQILKIDARLKSLDTEALSSGLNESQLQLK